MNRLRLLAFVILLTPISLAAQDTSRAVHLDSIHELAALAEINLLPEDSPPAQLFEPGAPLPQAQPVDTLPHSFSGDDGKVRWYKFELPPLVWDIESPPGLFVGFVSSFDEVYINGTRFGSNGGITRNIEDEAYGISRHYIIPATEVNTGAPNVLTIKVSAGAAEDGGIRSTSTIGPYLEQQRTRIQGDSVRFILSGIYLITGLLFISLYLRRRSSLEHLYFGLSGLAIFLYFFTRIQTTLTIVNGYAWPTRIEYISLWVSIPLFTLFIMQYFSYRVRWYHRAYLAFTGLCVIVGLFTPGTQLLAQLNFTLMQPSWILPFVMIMYILLRQFRRSPTARIILGGTMLVIVTIVFDILMSRRGASLFLSQYLLFPYIMLVAILVLHQLVNLYAEVERLYMLATRDGLTGVAIRNHSLMLFDRIISMARRHNRTAAVLMLDIDHFKLANDEYGHQAGDVVLKRVGELLSRTLRHEDIVGRYGGEEFLIILPETNAQGARSIADRMRTAIERLQFEELGERAGITVSIGVAMFPQNGADTAALIKSADAALYAAKKNGRNQVVLSGDSSE